MRIRKHAKISPAVHTTPSQKAHAHLQTHVCQLNQSPWDVMKFSPPSTPPPPPHPPQVDGDGGACGVDASSADCISVTEGDQSESSDDIPAEESPPPSPPAASKAKKIRFCCKTDGKSWRCKKEAAVGSSLCDHHMAQAKSYNSGSYVPKKPEKVSAEAQRPARTKKASTTSNPHEFYYYSGFGPWWGKKRGEASTTTTNTTSAVAGAANSSSSNNNNNNSNGSLSKNVERDVEMVDDESDSDEYEYEDEEETYKRDNGKKRVRKPIKARSLKSLM